jgi:hypothetical protein
MHYFIISLCMEIIKVTFSHENNEINLFLLLIVKVL